MGTTVPDPYLSIPSSFQMTTESLGVSIVSTKPFRTEKGMGPFEPHFRPGIEQKSVGCGQVVTKRQECDMWLQCEGQVGTKKALPANHDRNVTTLKQSWHRLTNVKVAIWEPK
jgi:hypothetical protein